MYACTCFAVDHSVCYAAEVVQKEGTKLASRQEFAKRVALDLFRCVLPCHAVLLLSGVSQTTTELRDMVPDSSMCSSEALSISHNQHWVQDNIKQVLTLLTLCAA